MPDEFVPTETLLALRHPDPDVDVIPMLTADEALALQTETAGHLIRAMTRLDDVIAAQTKRMDADVQAWGYEIGKLQARRENWRAMIRAWMERTGTFKLQTPWFTASLGKGRSKIVVDDEGKCIAACKAKYNGAAVKVIEKLDKKEFDSIWNATPTVFDGIAHEEQGEPTLRILKKEGGK